ncbi:MAG: GlsB/YeaQ/YmgE family stress response membrane protein [Actinobacteria bacterium]|nr:GlsB/YeaQ/YmgE family stress response membrane protein [Actinomycetota bacterium]MBV9664408.1 GlsB/YeaQ/YmgE family stress response membrane protein [Actinomycetota bacterium]MBV9936074.1 GlsB/YeaQ/YmgE family stress response membrane protein [Actinomycetota bacterium]
MDMILILWIVLAGLVVGALGRLAVPGPNPMSIGMTILVGLGGSIVGGIVGRVLFHRRGGIILSTLAAAGIVYLMQRNSHKKVGPPAP